MFDDAWILLRGVAVGVMIAAPVGPVALVCMRTTYDRGLRAGMAVGFGAALADVVYAVMAAFGLAAVARFFIAHDQLFGIAGGVVMLILAVIIWFTPVTDDTAIAVKERPGVKGSFALGFTMAFTNPLTVLGFAAVFVALGLAPAMQDLGDRLSLILGVALGSAGYWLGLAQLIARTRHLIPHRWLVLTNHGIAVLLLGFGLYTLYSGLFDEMPVDTQMLEETDGFAPAED